MDKAPDLIGPIKAYRVFDFRSGRLASPHREDYFWEAGENRAQCSPRIFDSPQEWRSKHPEGLPGKACECGLYAYKKPPPFYRYSQQAAVTGEVELWGRVEEYRQGYRAQKARITKLAIARWWPNLIGLLAWGLIFFKLLSLASFPIDNGLLAGSWFIAAFISGGGFLKYLYRLTIAFKVRRQLGPLVRSWQIELVGIKELEDSHKPLELKSLKRSVT